MTTTPDSSHTRLPVDGIAARLKLERLKRSWTQEHLAEVARLSVRTVQRIERGEDPSAETLRALAEALGVDATELRGSEIRRQFRAPWALSVKWITGAGVAIIIGGSVLAASHAPWLHYLLIGAIFVTLAFSVRGYSLRNGQLWVHRPGWFTRYPLATLTEITVNPRATMGSLRFFGSGGVFGFLGLFRNELLGRYQSYVTDPARSVVLRFDRGCIVISPDDPELFQRAVEAELAQRAPASPGVRTQDS